MSHRRAKRLRKSLNVKRRAYSNEHKPFETHFVLNQLKYVINPIRYTESSVRVSYKTYKKLHRENKHWKLHTLKHLHGSIWQ